MKFIFKTIDFIDVTIPAVEFNKDELQFHQLYSRTNEIPEIENISVYTLVENMPESIGRDDAINQFLASSITYPVNAENKGIQGTANFSVVIGIEGSPINIKFLRIIEGGCDKEALQVEWLMPEWIPG